MFWIDIWAKISYGQIPEIPFYSCDSNECLSKYQKSTNIHKTKNSYKEVEVHP